MRSEGSGQESDPGLHEYPRGVLNEELRRIEDAANQQSVERTTVNIDAMVPVGDAEPGRVEGFMRAAKRLGGAALRISSTALERLPFGGASVSWHPEQSDSPEKQKDE